MIENATANAIACTALFAFDADGVQRRLQQLRKRGFTDPTQAERCERDAELARRQIRIEIAVDLEQDASAPAIFLGERFDARLPQFDETQIRPRRKSR